MYPRTLVRRDQGLYALEGALRRRGFSLVAGSDEAGRGACAGPLVVAAVLLPAPPRGTIPGLADSKQLSPANRERVLVEIRRRALAVAVVVIEAPEIDLLGLHVANVAGMRRAVAALRPQPVYALTDGFPVSGMGMPALALWKGDQVAAAVAAASVVAKVTRDAIMVKLDEAYPEYGFAAHKGYATSDHSAALGRHGPCPQHRMSYANVASVTNLPGQGRLASDLRRRRGTVGVVGFSQAALDFADLSQAIGGV